MFLTNQPQKFKEDYFKLLKIMGALSNIYSDSDAPYLYYRGHENAFCKAFEADNLSRSDFSADAGKNGFGIGLKTFLNQTGNTSQKIAEFNKSRELFTGLESNPQKLIETISEMRNKRIETTKSVYGLDNMLYHCVTRSEKQFFIFEENMDLVDITNIKIADSNPKRIIFNDGIHEYKFVHSKSTLYKRFVTKDPFVIDVVVYKDPFAVLEKMFDGEMAKKENILETIFLPLYSKRGGKNVPERSGLNQWNAGGRVRKNKEVYIPIPLWIHHKFPEFFPSNEISFNLHLPNKRVLVASICQEGGKALMSNPNTDLGDWLIDDVLKIKEGKIVTYKDLEEIGIDSVSITKVDSQNYTIDFKSIDTYEDFFVKNYE